MWRKASSSSQSTHAESKQTTTTPTTSAHPLPSPPPPLFFLLPSSSPHAPSTSSQTSTKERRDRTTEGLGKESVCERETLFLTSEEMRQWVGEAAKWSSPLHFVDVNSPARTTFLLRDGADIHARLGSGLPTPLDVALAKGGDSSSLILRASKPWSVGTHSLFPSQARRRAYDLLKIGLLFAASRQKHAFFDVWQFLVMPHAIVRDEEATTTTP